LESDKFLKSDPPLYTTELWTTSHFKSVACYDSTSNF